MSGSIVARVTSPFAAALLIAVSGCMMASGDHPDRSYVNAYQRAIGAGQCEGEAVTSMWTAYNQWYAVASSIYGYYKSAEADALLRQGQQFGIMGCPAVARASYQALLQRFPGDDYVVVRNQADVAMRALPPPPPPPAPAPAPAANGGASVGAPMPITRTPI